MTGANYTPTPPRDSYDVVIVGGAIMGSSTAWWLTQSSHFQGSVLVVERDPTYGQASTSHTNSCIRQQFSNEINIRISQFGVEFIRAFPDLMGDVEAPEITLQDFGYMYLAADPAMVENLRACQQIQSSLGAGTRLMTPEQIAAEYPFYVLDDIVMGSHNPKDEGYFDGGTIFDWFKRMARRNGVDYCHNSVVDIPREGGRVTGVTLASGQSISAGVVVNASGPRASLTAQMAGLDVPVEPRRRYTFIFDAEKPLDQVLPLTIDPSGCHMRQDGRYYLCGCPPDEDPTVDHDDFYLDHAIWEEKLWPTIAARVPAFEAVKVVNSWVGHYAYNTLDQNAIIGFHPEVSNFLFLNGFSGHGLQQSPAMGRAAAELIGLGRFETLDMTELGYERILAGRPFLERAVI